MVCQVFGEYKVREKMMQQYLFKVYQLTAYFESFEIQKIPRSQNKRADALSLLASTFFLALNKIVFVEVLIESGYLEEKSLSCALWRHMDESPHQVLESGNPSRKSNRCKEGPTQSRSVYTSGR